MGKAVVMESVFFTNGIVSLAVTVVYAISLIKNFRYCPKYVPGDIVDRNILDKEVVDVDMFESDTEYGKPFSILCFKEPDYVMNIMASWTALDELEGGNTKRNYKSRYGESLVKI